MMMMVMMIVQMSNIKLMAIKKVNVMSEKTYNSHQSNTDDISRHLMQNNIQSFNTPVHIATVYHNRLAKNMVINFRSLQLFSLFTKQQ